jgi:hypothetical protein
MNPRCVDTSITSSFLLDLCLERSILMLCPIVEQSVSFHNLRAKSSLQAGSTHTRDVDFS